MTPASCITPTRSARSKGDQGNHVAVYYADAVGLVQSDLVKAACSIYYVVIADRVTNWMRAVRWPGCAFDCLMDIRLMRTR